MPLMYVRDGDASVVANTRPPSERKNPWTLNLAAAATATIRVGRVGTTVSVRLADGAYADAIWPRIVEQRSALDALYKGIGDRWCSN